MKHALNIHLVWLIMMALTLLTYAIDTLNYAGFWVAGILLVTTGFKGVLIIRDFMELKGVSFIWRALMYGWLWAIILAIGITYTLSI